MSIRARLPGIEFEKVSPPSEETLVRMDIAAFVGFAADGPLDLPVAVESIPEFEQVFKSDVVLGTERDSKQVVYGYLAPAVRAFFRNGGRRCWIVRVDGGPDSGKPFSSKLFLDSRLEDSSEADLLRDAEAILVESDKLAHLTAPPLRGIHALLTTDEATILCVPDAVQRGWTASEKDAIPSPIESSPLAHPEWWHFLDCWKMPEIPRTAELPTGQFQPCGLQPIPAPLLNISPAVNGTFTLTWTVMEGYVDSLEEAVDPAFQTASVISSGTTGTKTLYGRPAGSYYYRVRRQLGTRTSDYSNGVGIRIAVGRGWEEVSEKNYSEAELLKIHCAMLRMCAARGDMFSLLALPGHYREPAVEAYAIRIKKQTGGSEIPIASLAIPSLSYGGIYHPWIVGREENDLLELRTNPPDGAIAGIMAARSAARGAWVSPANEPLHGVVAMTPPFAKTADSRMELQVVQVNAIAREPQGFLCLSETTLSPDDELQPINVRRLLSFLRKEAIQAGVEYVFEPNGDEFRRGVQRGFEKLMDRLFLRGAFAGRFAREAYQVVADSAVNARLQDLGQFVVELRVAPSVPMRFLKIRLLQAADRTFVTEGR